MNEESARIIANAIYALAEQVGQLANSIADTETDPTLSTSIEYGFKELAEKIFKK